MFQKIAEVFFFKKVRLKRKMGVKKSGYKKKWGSKKKVGLKKSGVKKKWG